MAVISANEQERWATLDAAWKEQITPIFAEIAALNSALAPDFPEWSAQFIEAWKPHEHFTPATRFAQFQIDLAKRADASTTVSRLALPGAPQVSIPLALTFPQQGSLLLETKESCGGAAMSVLNNVMLRLLTTTPPGKIAFTIIDPVGLGENFAGFMHLGDYEEAVINRRIWTQRDQIDERLTELNAHIEKVIQMYLRNDARTSPPTTSRRARSRRNTCSSSSRIFQTASAKPRRSGCRASRSAAALRCVHAHPLGSAPAVAGRIRD